MACARADTPGKCPAVELPSPHAASAPPSTSSRPSDSVVRAYRPVMLPCERALRQPNGSKLNPAPSCWTHLERSNACASFCADYARLTTHCSSKASSIWPPHLPRRLRARRDICRLVAPPLPSLLPPRAVLAALLEGDRQIRQTAQQRRFLEDLLRADGGHRAWGRGACHMSRRASGALRRCP